MDGNEKLMRMMDMLENPDRYTDRQFEDMFCDNECRGYYDMMVALHRMYRLRHQGMTTQDIDNEWRKFESRHLTPLSVDMRGTVMRKVAAVVCIVIAVSCISYAAIHLITVKDKDVTKPDEIGITTVIEQRDTAVASRHADAGDIPSYGIKTYDNAELDVVLADIASFYGLELEYRSDNARHIRLFFQWNPQEVAEQAIGSLNRFERVNIRLEGKKLIVE
ncbi:MAG: hypothetical protein K2H16_05360 [Prevotella sp.]|nr:hypothetical protein [Prevotella sp.]MDE6150396.1 hypothetical protein [Prevotella sp.]